MSNDTLFPKLKKKLSSFVDDEEGTVLRSKAAIVGPLAVGAVVLMSKEMTIEAQASKFHSHLSHRSHSSGSTGSGHSSHVSHSNGSTTTAHSNSTPSHSSHSSGSTSGFSHTAGTFAAEGRSAENN